MLYWCMLSLALNAPATLYAVDSVSLIGKIIEFSKPIFEKQLLPKIEKHQPKLERYLELTENLPILAEPFLYPVQKFANLPATEMSYPMAEEEVRQVADEISAIPEQPTLTLEDLPESTQALHNLMKKNGFIKPILYDDIWGLSWDACWNKGYYLAGKYKSMKVSMAPLKPHKEQLLKEIRDPENPTKKTNLFYLLLRYYNRIDAGSTTEKAIREDGVDDIYDLVVDDFEEKKDGCGLELHKDLEPAHIVKECPDSPYILNAIQRNFKKKKQNFCANSLQPDECKHISEVLQKFNQELEKSSKQISQS